MKTTRQKVLEQQSLNRKIWAKDNGRMHRIDDNKLIAEFMGDYNFEHTEGGLPIGDFSNSWDWLMPVVEKIESFQDGENGDSMRGHLYNFRIEQNFVYILDGESMDVIIEMNGDSKINATYNAVVEFINQYNKNK